MGCMPVLGLLEEMVRGVCESGIINLSMGEEPTGTGIALFIDIFLAGSNAVSKITSLLNVISQLSRRRT
jgi:hypothetical protein